VQRRGLRHHPEPFVSGADQAGHPPAAVRADEVPATDAVLAAGGVVAGRGPYALGVLLKSGQLMAEPDPPRRELLRAGLQQRLQADVRRVSEHALDLLRAQIAAAFGDDPRSPVTDQLARFALAAIDGAFVAWQADREAALGQLLQSLAPWPVAARRALLAKAD